MACVVVGNKETMTARDIGMVRTLKKEQSRGAGMALDL